MNVAMICETVIEPPKDGNITRDDIKCKISYTAEGQLLYICLHFRAFYFQSSHKDECFVNI